MNKINILQSAHIGCKNSILLEGGNDEATEIGCFAFLIRRNGENILVDTGIMDLDIVNQTKSSKDDWQRYEYECDVVADLKKYGLTPDDISKVFLTHSHYDHLSGIQLFKNAKIYMSKVEYDFLTTTSPHKKFLTEQIEFLQNSNLTLIEQDGELEPGIFAICVAGHTPGSVMYKIDDVLLTGDNIFMLEGIEKNKRIGFCMDEAQAKRAVSIAAAHRGTVLTSHDKECLKCLN